ncbi:MAG TPA: acyltransferase [Pseudomonadales bacterium]|nr:acyltransferase [Pseudomonadales bacterium]
MGRGVRILGPIYCRNGRGLEIGDRAVVGRGAKINLEPGGKLTLGYAARIGEGVLLTVKRGGVMRLGDHALINTRSIVTCWSQVTIGAGTLVAPHCHITDRNHGIAPGVPIRQQRGEIAPITIGANAWIASSCIVLKGSTIGDGAVVGANSVVTAEIPPQAIAVGSPARVIGARSDRQDGA